MFDAPFLVRLVLLFVLLGALAALERAFRGEDAVRGRCLGVLAGAGACSAAFGALLDAVTVSISPLYYTVGKGLSPEHLVRDAILLGAEAGASAGLLVGAIAAHVETRGGAQIRICATLRSLISVPRNAAVLGTVAGAVGLVWFSASLVFLRPMSTRFTLDSASLVVLCVHVGVYAGGIAAVVRWVRGRVRETAPESEVRGAAERPRAGALSGTAAAVRRGTARRSDPNPSRSRGDHRH